MAETTEEKINRKNNGHKQDLDPKIVEKYLEGQNKKEVPHAYDVLFNQEDEKALNKTTRVNGREVLFFSVNAIRDIALVPPKSKLNPNGRPSISTCLRMELKAMKISEGGHGRDDVKEVNQLTQDDIASQQGNTAQF